MAKEFSRSERVASQIQRELAVLIQSQIKDPRLGFVTISEVEVTRDLAIAKVYFSLLNAESSAVELNRQLLTEAVPFMRKQLRHSMKMRSIPELRFVYDDSIERGMRMDALLKDIQTDPAQGDEAAGDDES